MKIVLGLGNPGRKYEHTRHNIGFDVLDGMAAEAGVRFRKKWLMPLQSAEIEVGSETVLLVKPMTFMNRSGSALRPLVRRHGLAPEDVIVVLDDLDLEAGRLRIRKRGGAGGHKGLQSVLATLGTENFPRVRLGIGPRPVGEDLTGYVLARFGAAEREAAGRAVRQAGDAVRMMVEAGVDQAMNKFNSETK
ncbi:MAG TPA: aminoacyl-tRNA hydrolase [Kiritimatiellia bacterium]|nr:aminoacyl-tRNA hydrolase [Kiritimatiellia bacterium]HRZ12997.1 aminoacyl-tRNA hydrolase [Kiritimatiellia bacterium]HSA18393.1 aminoacyl-tRNA hydrolase [Kiritimatiellia bacterium]